MQIGQRKRGLHLVLALTALLPIASTFLSCRQQKQSTLDKLQGHWHMDSPYRMTLDINNSSVEMNKYSLVETPRRFPLFDSVTNDILLPIPCGNTTLPSAIKFSFRADTLIYDDEIVERCSAYGPMKFVRGAIEMCRWKHTFQGRSINVKLVAFPIRTSSVVDLDSLRRTSLVSYINIGIPERVDMFGLRPKIQVSDVFVEPPGIKQFILSEKWRADGKPLVLCLNVDNAVSELLLEEVISSIPKDSVAAIYRLVTLPTEEDKYGYQKMKR